MASFVKNGPLWGPGSSSSATAQQQNGHGHGHGPDRRQSWATATWATGQSIISGMMNRKGYDMAQHYRPGEYRAFRDEILMPPAYDSIVPRTQSAPQKGQDQQQQQQQQSPSPLFLSLPQWAHPPHATAVATPTTTTPTTPSGPPRLQPIELPPLPRLLGIENLDEWDDMLMRTLRLHGLAEYVTSPYPGIPDPLSSSSSSSHPTTTTTKQAHAAHARWAADRASACLLIVGSLSTDVRDTLLAHGYDPAEQDPRAVRELVLEALPRAAGEDVASWMRELGGIAPSDPGCGGTLRGYCLRLQYLRRRLYQAEPQPNDNLVLVMAVLGLARCERYEGLSMSLGRELERGGLSWARLMGDLSTVHGREVREKRGKAWKAVDDARS